MKGKQLALVLILLVVLGGVALWLHGRSSASWSNTTASSGDRVLNFQLNDVVQVRINGEGAELNLVKQSDVWKVKERTDYPADFTKVAGLIRKLWELHPAQDVKVGPSQLARLQLTAPGSDANSGTLVDLMGSGDKQLAALLLGKKYLKESPQATGRGSFPAGRYVMEQDKSDRVFLVADSLDDVQTKPEQWLSPDFIKVEKPKVIALAAASAEASWKIGRDTESASWKLLDAKPGEELDASKTSNLTSLLTNVSFADVLGADAPVTETGLDQPTLATIETFDGFAYELRIGKPMGDNYPVLVSVKADLPKERTPAADEKPEDKPRLDQEFQTKQKQLSDKLAKEQKLEPRPYLIAKATIEQLLKERSALLLQKEASPSPSSAAPADTKKAIVPAPVSTPTLPRRP